MSDMERPALPERRNPMLEEEHAPQHEILVERRCLGQTELRVKPGQVGTSNATKAENLGTLDYAHLRVPLPKDLAGSGIFTKGTDRKWPQAYFLMRRSSDGFISATGMFKAAFPFSQSEEESVEKEYIKTLKAASSEEVAGNVWIDPGKALELAREYGIELWIAALLDPEPITHGASDPNKAIKSPPPYKYQTMANGRTQASPDAGKRSTRGARSLRSISPSGASVSGKAEVSPRKKATPRPRRAAKPKGGLSNVDEVYNPETNGEKSETVRVEVESSIQPGAKGELIEKTKTSISLPAGAKDIPLENGEGIAEFASKIAAEANKMSGSSAVSRGKRKADVAGLDELEVEQAPARPAKRQRQPETSLRVERIRRKALTGIAATFVIGALIPAVLNFL